MEKRLVIFMAFLVQSLLGTSQGLNTTLPLAYQKDTTSQYLLDTKSVPVIDTIPQVSFREVNIIYFKTDEERQLYYKYKSRIQKVLPYVKIAKQLYAEISQEKETSKKRDYRHFKKDVESEMRKKFEKELKDLTTGQGEMLFKLINRETKNNAYTIIKEIKGGLTAWFYQMVGKRYGYDLKENYDPQKEHLIEMIIKELGPAYNVQS
jgi:hypothetical protein